MTRARKAGMTKLNLLLSCFMLMLLSMISMLSVAKTIEDLIANNELSVSLRIDASDSIVAKQPVTLVIDIATNRWFAKGTRIHDIDLAESVILPFNERAINGSQRINGVTWAVQTREVIIYPMQVGVYELGPILVDVSVNTEHDGIVSGTIKTKATEFETSKPIELKDIEHYIVTPELSIAVDGIFDSNHEYQIGDAITETVTITVKNTPAMMITPLVRIPIQGLSIYQNPVNISDKNVRGEITGIRKESVTYIFEQAGDFQLPQQTIYWWNPDSAQLEKDIVPARNWSVIDNGLLKPELFSRTSLWPLSVNAIVNILIVLLLFLIVWKCYKYKTWLVNLYEKISNKAARENKKRFLNAIHQQQWQVACQCLYVFIRTNNVSHQMGTVLYPESNATRLKDYFLGDAENTLLVNKLLQVAYQNSDEKLNIIEAKKLIKNKLKTNSASVSTRNSNKIQLNPVNDD